jgi:hypothetical protein
MPKVGKEKIKKAHGDAARVVNHPKFVELFQELDENEAMRDEVRRDPKGALKQRGVPIPDDMEVTVEEGSWCICLTWGWWGVCFWRVCFPWP